MRRRRSLGSTKLWLERSCYDKSIVTVSLLTGLRAAGPCSPGLQRRPGLKPWRRREPPRATNAAGTGCRSARRLQHASRTEGEKRVPRGTPEETAGDCSGCRVNELAQKSHAINEFSKRPISRSTPAASTSLRSLVHAEPAHRSLSEGGAVQSFTSYGLASRSISAVLAALRNLPRLRWPDHQADLDA